MDALGGVWHLGVVGAFVVFVALAVIVGARTGAPARPPVVAQRRISVLIGWVLLVSMTAGFTQRDMFPFAHWQLLANKLKPEWRYPLVLGVDAAGDEHRIDYRAYDPMSFAELMAYLDGPFLRLPPEGRDSVAAHLLAAVNAARLRAQAGEDIRRTGRWLGPFRALYFDLSPALWDRPESVPPTPLVRLRLYRQRWIIEDRHRDPTAVSRRLLYEGPGR